MDMQKERELFLAHMRSIGSAGFMFELDEDGNFDDMSMSYAWSAWQAAKALPEKKQFNLDEFLAMEEKLKHKGGAITADLDRFIAYAESVLIQAKALKEPK